MLLCAGLIQCHSVEPTTSPPQISTAGRARKESAREGVGVGGEETDDLGAEMALVQRSRKACENEAERTLVAITLAVSLSLAHSRNLLRMQRSRLALWKDRC